MTAPCGGSGATLSACERYRFALWRVWDPALPAVVFIGLNPSTADAEHDDPTIRRCIGFARAAGGGGLRMLNLFAWRSTDPAGLRRAVDPIGPNNNDQLLAGCVGAALVIAAWGAGGGYLSRDREVRQMLDAAGVTLCHLGLTKDGHPRHPLYLPKTATPTPWPRATRTRGAA